MELVGVLVALVILGAVLVPTLSGLSRDSNVKAGADLLRQRISDARSHAIADGREYAVSVSSDGTKVRVMTDSEATTSTPADGGYKSNDDFESTVKAVPQRASSEAEAPTSDADGWIRVATFIPDGSCKEESPIVDVTEEGTVTLRLEIRGFTGAVTVTPIPEGSR